MQHGFHRARPLFSRTDACRRRSRFGGCIDFRDQILHRGIGGVFSTCQLVCRGLHMWAQVVRGRHGVSCGITAPCSNNLHEMTGANAPARLWEVSLHGGKDLTFLHRPLTYHSARLQTVSGCNMHGSCSISPTKHMSPCPKYNLKWLMHRLPHPGISVYWETGKFCCCCLFSLKKFLPCSGATWLKQPQPVAIQLSLRDSSCAVLDRQETSTQRSLC